MITPPNGKPIDSLRDQYEWKALLAEAGVRRGPPHDGSSRGRRRAGRSD